MAPTVGGLFSGIGGFTLACERAGFTPRWECEIDPAARSVLAHHWPSVPCHTDVTALDPADLAPVDVVTFGSPCQDLSVAGKRAGLEGARSGLFYEAIRIIRAVRPAFAVWENVPGALSSAQGRDFGCVLDALADCGALDIGWRVLDAQWFGVAQRRRRVFLVADFRGQRTTEILFESEGSERHSPPRRETGAGSAHGTRPSLEGFSESGQGWWRDGVGPLRAEGENRPSRPSTLIAQDGNLIRADSQAVGANQTTGFHGEAVLAHALCSPTAKGGDPTTDTYVIKGAAIGRHPSAGPQRGEVLGDGSVFTLNCTEVHAVTHSLRPEGCDASEDGTGRGVPLVAFRSTRDGSSLDECSPTLTIGTGLDIPSPPPVATGMAVRRLTPRECERLQGFPDDWTAGQPDTTRYRQLGNAVCVNAVEWLARRLYAVLEAE